MTSPLTDEQLKDMLAGCEGELLPCPFCGAEAALMEWEFDSHDSCAYCTACDITGPQPGSKNLTWDRPETHAELRRISNAEAIAAWNRRAVPVSSLITELLELRAERGKE